MTGAQWDLPRMQYVAFVGMDRWMLGSSVPLSTDRHHIISAGPSANGLADPSKHTRFVRGMLQLVGQRDSTYLYGNVTRHLSQHNLLCASRGAIVGELFMESCAPTPSDHRRCLHAGTHPYIFPARADAWLFRQTAYDWAGLTRELVTSHDNHCPRKILVVTRRFAGQVI